MERLRYQRLKQEADGQIQKGQKELSRAKETLQSAKNQIDQAQKQLDLQEAQFKKLAPFLPAKEQVASQEKLPIKPKNNWIRKRKTGLEVSRSLQKRGGAEKSPNRARSARNPNLSCL